MVSRHVYATTRDQAPHPPGRNHRPSPQDHARGNADAFNELPGTGKLRRDALTMVAAAAWWTQRRLGINEPLWTLIGLHRCGRSPMSGCTAGGPAAE
ncbi:hypothetical protein [Mycobacterium paragordonae]|uniref:Uncharacterized protein n=1 Tax=Mycobacterium paragordonae TaxID=1389713 RepID=A0AAJ1SBT6_9MYCO|nr:hypothetical protein [Mycobacterium paragordonae]MDP7739642.1 hypothetical protein [Mycobacterium paragordonae]